MKYKVLSNLKHDKKEYVKGDKIELDKDEAKALVADGVLKRPKKKRRKRAEGESVQVPVKGEDEDEGEA